MYLSVQTRVKIQFDDNYVCMCSSLKSWHIGIVKVLIAFVFYENTRET